MICRKHHHGRLFGFTFCFLLVKCWSQRSACFIVTIEHPEVAVFPVLFYSVPEIQMELLGFWLMFGFRLLSCCCLLVVVFLLLSSCCCCCCCCCCLRFTISPGITGNNRGRFFRMLGNPSVVFFSVFKSSSVLGCEIQSTSLYVSTSNLLLLPEPEGKSKKGYFWETMWCHRRNMLKYHEWFLSAHTFQPILGRAAGLWHVLSHWAEILGLNQHLAKWTKSTTRNEHILFTRRSWKLNNRYTNPTTHLHLLYIYIYPKGTLTGVKTSSSHGKAAFLYTQINFWMRMENGALALPRVFFGGTYRWGTWVDFWSSRACCKFVTLAASQVVIFYQLQTPFGSWSLLVLMGVRNTKANLQCIASSMCIEFYCAYTYIYIF